MKTIGTVLVICMVSALAANERQASFVETSAYRATVSQGCLSGLETAKGEKLVVPGDEPSCFTVYRGSKTSTAGRVDYPSRRLDDGSEVSTHTDFDGLKNAAGELRVSVEKPSGDLIVEQTISCDTPNIWGVGWSVGRIPLDCSVIVPGHSGLRLSRDMLERRMQFDYPKGWEAQLVIVEGPGYGFYVWADDTAGRYKRLVVERHKDGWELWFITQNDAPFDELTSCRSVPWHVNTYVGDWRVPARRYRDWAVRHFKPVPIDRQKPEWVRDTRVMVITGLDPKQLPVLAERLDPKQTVLYIPSWRAAGYDRDYPTYDEPVEGLRPFMEQAHLLGFRVMLHVNYFGVDPKNPLYAQFEPYQVRNCFGKHDRKWWLWTRAEPEIRFAYINPALKAWRDVFTERMVNLCREYDVDALHLDQTLCIDNDHNGRIEGLSMLEGNLALHRQLREALPDVALSGEGLNEVTYRYEAFAQRHVYGLNHSDGTWDRRRLAMAHPISSYLFRPYTIINGYLGCTSPSQGQLYAAWNEAYEHWGVIPTLKPSGVDMADPKGFARQFFDEAAFWQDRRLEIDIDRDWPATVAFPFKTGDGEDVCRRIDGRLTCGDATISQTITGVSSLESVGTVPGWRAYDDSRVLGLDPEQWYPVFAVPRPSDVFHVSELPDGMIARTVLALNDLGMIRTESCRTVVADLVKLLDGAVGGSRPFQGEGYEVPAPFASDDGAVFQIDPGNCLFAHPPWKAPLLNPKTGEQSASGTGITYVRYSLELPDGHPWFLTDVAMRTSSVGQPNSDGATFRVRVRSEDVERSAEVHQATDRPARLSLDLTDLAGKAVELELSVDPGPKRSPSFDWALWNSPRVELDQSVRGTMALAGDTRWKWAMDGGGPVALRASKGTVSMKTLFPGTTYLLRREPTEITMPCDLAAVRRLGCVLDETGREMPAGATSDVHVSQTTVGGVSCRGLFAHPPDGGQRVILIPVVLPMEPSVFRAKVGLRDGSKSTGVLFIMEANGKRIVEKLVLPGEWHDVEADLTAWRNQPVVLSLITDSAGSHYFDWAHWGEPRLELKEAGAPQPLEAR